MNLPIVSLIRSGSYFAAIAYLVSVFVIVFLVLPVHEFAHAFMSDKLGDKTARYNGRLTLNPMAHIDWIGAVAILLVGFGWAKPVPVNASNFKKPKWGMALTALAGPVSNLLMGFLSLVLSAAVIKIGIAANAFFLIDSKLYMDNSTMATVFEVIYSIFGFMASINIGLAVFNLIPIPPLDGSRLLTALLPDRIYYKIMRYERFIMLGLIVLLWVGALSVPLSFLRRYVILGMSHLVAPMFGFDPSILSIG